MTAKQTLGFNITETLLDEHNQELQEKGRKFFDEFNEVFKILCKSGYTATEFESLMYDYLRALKIEYYKAGEVISDIVDSAEVKECIEELTA